MTQALNQTRDLMRGLESLDHRMWQPGDRSAQDPSSEGQLSDGQPQQGGQQAGDQSAQGSADGQPGVGDAFGGPLGAGGWGDRRPGSTVFDPQDVRQWQREFRERAGDAQDIRRLLEQEGFSAGELDEVIRQMQELDDSRLYQDAEVIARLQTFILEELKRFEYRLRREVDSENEELFLASSDEVPPGFRDLIEEYYRALSKDD